VTAYVDSVPWLMWWNDYGRDDEKRHEKIDDVCSGVAVQLEREGREAPVRPGIPEASSMW